MRWFGVAKLETGQISVGTSATLILPARRQRRSLLIVQHGSNAVYIGKDENVTLTTGVLLTGTVGSGISIPTTGEIWGIAGSAQTVSYIEIY